MKKLIITALCLVCALGLGACSDTADAGDTTKDGVIGDGFQRRQRQLWHERYQQRHH